MMPVLRIAPHAERLSSLVTIGGVSLDLTQIVVLAVIFATLVLLWYANRPSTIQRYSAEQLEREDPPPSQAPGETNPAKRDTP